jgi:hypothetical protein
MLRKTTEVIELKKGKIKTNGFVIRTWFISIKMIDGSI